MKRLLTPEWVGGWLVTRYLFVSIAALTHIPRFWKIEDAYAAPDMVFTNGWFQTHRWLDFTPFWGFTTWTLALVGLGFILIGRRAFYLGMLLWLVSGNLLIMAEALNVKAYDRLLFWIGLGLLFSPYPTRSLLVNKQVNSARFWILILFCSMYGSTGLMKLLHEPGWLNGQAMSYHLVNLWHGGRSLGVYISDLPAIPLLLGWTTLLFELTFPVLIWFRRTNPWILLCGVLFHCGILLLMNVATFSLVALIAYPVLLNPSIAEKLWQRLFTTRESAVQENSGN